MFGKKNRDRRNDEGASTDRMRKGEEENPSEETLGNRLGRCPVSASVSVAVKTACVCEEGTSINFHISSTFLFFLFYLCLLFSLII